MDDVSTTEAATASGTTREDGTTSAKGKEKLAAEDTSAQDEMWKEVDDWSGLADSKERRKLQNRLNQRLWRKRHNASNSKRKRKKDAALALAAAPTSTTTHDRSSPASTSSSSSQSNPHAQLHSHSPSSRSSSSSTSTSTSTSDLIYVKHPYSTPSAPSMCHMTSTQLSRLAHAFETGALSAYLHGSPQTDQLFTLIQFNVFRGLLHNVNQLSALGFDMGWTNHAAISPFYTSAHSNSPPPSSTFLPDALKPTALQRSVEHHPWIDLFPFRELRDNFLRQGEEYDDEPLCMDLVEFVNVPHEKTGLILWGEPWDPEAWEVSPEFVRKWTWLLRGCAGLMRATNRWRERRGEGRLFVVREGEEEGGGDA